ncbi:MAG TPA: PQQ-dependent sugar dehydrogenase [Candidatus Limnocylindrales bacterium]|nr:PQQ-dependent sugar dehydrogenase [Candidatus Limnocylindrales bacterium]
MKKFLGLILVIIVLSANGLTATKNSSKKNINHQVSKSPSMQNDSESASATVIAENLEVPWALVFLPDESILVTERPGRVRLIDRNGQLVNEPILEIDVVKRIQGEGGLHGITVHPEFEKNKLVYLYYTYANEGNKSLNRVSRYNFTGDKLTNEKIIVDKIPGALFHDGGRIKFGPDKLLYITTGDAQEPSLAQNKNSLAGKIIRVTPEGKAAPGNPFNTLIYSYGHRNPQGITWDESGNLYETEHGSSEKDELNRIEIGKNYGWPDVKGDEKRNGLVPPLVHSGTDTWAPGGAAYLNGSVYFVGLRGKSLYQATLSGNTTSINTHLNDKFGRIRDVVVGPDNMLYITTSNRDGRGDRQSGDDKIISINPAKL